MVKRILFFLSLLILSHASLALENLTASVDKNPVLAGEYFTLSIIAEGKVKGTIPDVSVLSNDFITSPVNTSSRTSIINGSVSSSTTWQMQLVARTPGTYTIPALEVDGETTQPIEIKVVARDDEQQSEDIFVKTELKTKNLYVQQAALYTVKLYVGKELLDGQLSAPISDGANFTQLGKANEEYEVIDGRRYMVLTREYMIQPQKSGDFSIEPPIFNGQIRDGYRRMATSAVGNTIDFSVSPIPANAADNWLPSEYLNFSEEWQPKDTEFMVGTPITRTLTLTAVGVTKEQLPDIQLEDVNGFRIYPDASERKQITRDGKVISQLTISFAYLPQLAGDFTLPEVKLPWFNTITKREEFATLPSKSVSVIHDPNQPALPQTAPIPQPLSSPSVSPSTATQTNVITEQIIPLWMWGLAAFGYALWLITLLIWRLRAKPASNPVVNRVIDENPAPFISFEEAVKQDNPAGFYQALLRYTKQQNITMTQWLALQPSSLRAQVQTLQSSLYGGNSAKVDLAQLYGEIKTSVKSTVHTNKSQNLGNLYQ
ncbi:protein BatD [Pseudoalteromonas piscicida]|uniref:Protein BatD n=1 Tax=Pseudoalteromonas piscicida TaxID=43662 RepID=A0AAQ2IQ06_PSEO7|nr:MULTISPECIES: BatD family protein [Pseudoalteromonas]KJY86123.1 protein BatD [Pseudoalteromonas piscicida]MDP4486345.1 BatD family protein [Pseudoalteromonas piscicida]TMN35428.1 protein BatD [Pseudoalteromonas piscicida]TMN37979.1 protein BatD [Pseudoalteromonas piscicida]TMN47126.1 protein BatD [Pseudoalteromonas piscicida]